MKTLLIAAAIVGVAGAAVILYVRNRLGYFSNAGSVAPCCS